jgi:hypothetical protein
MKSITQIIQALKIIIQNINFYKKKEKDITKIKVYEYYDFCKKFPELLYLYDIVKAQNNVNFRFKIDLTNILENFSTIQRMILITHLKKIDRRVLFDDIKIQNILLDRWQKFNLTEDKYDELCQPLTVVYKGSPVLAVIVTIPNYSAHQDFGVNYDLRQNELSKYSFSDTESIPIVLTACSGMRDHYMTQDELITKDELDKMVVIFRKEKIKKLNKI